MYNVLKTYRQKSTGQESVQYVIMSYKQSRLCKKRKRKSQEFHTYDRCISFSLKADPKGGVPFTIARHEGNWYVTIIYEYLSI